MPDAVFFEAAAGLPDAAFLGDAAGDFAAPVFLDDAARLWVPVAFSA
ncbi:MAG: hypothetical protein ACI4MF_13505 [Candidatus Faecivicinus sp.]